MPTFQSKTYRRATTASSSLGERLGAFYRARLARHPFLLFGFPFIAIIVAGSFALTPAAAVRYERYDRRVKQLSQAEAMDLGLKGSDGDEGIKRNPRRRIVGDEKEEYYVCTTDCLRTWGEMLMEGMLTAAHGQGPGQLGAETGAAIPGRAGRAAIGGGDDIHITRPDHRSKHHMHRWLY